MTGTDRLRTLAGEWDAWGLGGALGDVARQIERERACDADTIENVRLIVGGVVDEMGRHVSGAEGAEDSPVARWARELRDALKSYTSDAAEDVSMSAYDLLQADEREAIAWVREHGGLSHVKDIYHDFRAVVECLGIEWSESELHGLMDALRGTIEETCARLGVEHTGDLTQDAQAIWREVSRLKSLLGDSVPRASYERHLARLQRQIDESHAALRRRNARIAELARSQKFREKVTAALSERGE